MVPSRKKLLLSFLLVGMAWSLATNLLHGKVFVCEGPPPPTLTVETNQASMVLVGTFRNAKKAANTMDFVVRQVFKSHEILKDSKIKTVGSEHVITLDRYIPKTKDRTFLVFLDVFKGQIDAYRGVELKNGDQLIGYLKGAVALKEAPLDKRVRYYFKHLNNPEPEVAADAFQEFVRADLKKYMEVARKLPAEKLANWLQDPKTPREKLGLYASLLGLCGKTEHGSLLRKMIDNPINRKNSDIAGMLLGYAHLRPDEGWKYINKLFKDQEQDLVMRYAALRATDSLWEKPPSHMTKKDLAEGVALLFDDGDVADLAIERMRKWQRWEMTDRVIALFDKPSHDNPLVKRNILLFALQSPTPSATAFVQAQRQRDAGLIADVEENLKQE